jgi:uncharacterized membrane protein YvbJ
MKGSFFCEACGTEVTGRADTCPSCGRPFLGIRCPKCGREGSAGDFRNGCPDCGFLTEGKTASSIKTQRKQTSGATKPAPEEKTIPWPDSPRVRGKNLWPAARYWTLSALIVVGLGLIIFFWIRK